MTKKERINLVLKRDIKDGNQYNSLIAKPNDEKINLKSGNTFHTVQMMKGWILKYYHQVALLAVKLQGENLEKTCFNIHSFLYNHIQYNIDGWLQNLRSPANTWENRFTGIDCKSYSIMASSCLTSLGLKHYIRQIKQLNFNPNSFSHVYIIVPKNQITGNLKDGYYTIDGTISRFEEPFYTKAEDIFMDKLPHYGLNASASSKKKQSKTSKKEKIRTSTKTSGFKRFPFE